MGKLKTQPGTGQKEKEHASCHGHLAKGTEGQPGPPACLTYKPRRLAEMFLLSLKGLQRLRS